MKILHIIAQLPSKTGSGVYFTNIIKNLSHTAEQACVYGCFSDYDYEVLPKDRQYPVLFPNEEAPFLLPGMSDVMPYPSTVYGEMTEEMIEQWQRVFEKKVKEAYADFQPDIIICHHLWMLTSLVRSWFKTDKVYAFCHGTDARQAEQHPQLKERYVKNLGELDQVFSLSSLQNQRISDIFNIPLDKIQVIGGGYDETIFYPPTNKTKNECIEVVYAGKISQAKGVFQLVEAFEQIIKRHAFARLSIIGNVGPEDQAWFKHYTDRYPQIRVFNVDNQRALADCFRQADVFVLPSYFEGLGLVAIESLACGNRVVVTDIPALKQQLGEQVNDSGVIEYVSLPRLYNKDEPYPEDLEDFRRRLANALCKQIIFVENEQPIDPAIFEKIEENSWSQLIKKLLPFLVK
ncbi:glycosyltransferase family 4 protein [Vagococcus humatus]|uniref:Glycosyl transferase family 1 n=1 Tax=Vagococcus humatus TaxID=1889241 RepID=A0A429Z983_9ENTE|nr:glycosyltransferase family 4 protein [Vagococcus humatus]RST90269.1 glycosyl transferase family 1 [Vagococcus humatus]